MPEVEYSAIKEMRNGNNCHENSNGNMDNDGGL